MDLVSPGLREYVNNTRIRPQVRHKEAVMNLKLIDRTQGEA